MIVITELKTTFRNLREGDMFGHEGILFVKISKEGVALSLSSEIKLFFDSTVVLKAGKQ